MITDITNGCTLITIDSQSSITIFIDDETGKLLAVRTYNEGYGAFYLDVESFGKMLAEHYGYKYVDYTQSTNDYGGIKLIVLIHIVNSFITA